jgi:TonB family protein
MRRRVAAILLALAAAASTFGQTDPEAARREMNLGLRAYRSGRFEEAERHFRRTLELDPTQKNVPLFIARALQQQYKPGVDTPENLAAGERAVAAYQEILRSDPANEDAYKAVVFLYGQLKQEDRVRELLLARANDFNAPGARRAEAFALLAGKSWSCSGEVTEQKENKTTAETPQGPVVTYKMPADPGEHIRARQCVNEGLQLVEQAVALDPNSENAWSVKANLLREASKLAEMEGDAAQKAEYFRQHEEALAAHRRASADAAAKAATGAEGGRPPAVRVPLEGAGTQGAKRAPITGGILNGKAVSKPLPAYPPDAKAARAQGTVAVKILVDEEGRVVEAVAVSGHPLLRPAAEAAALQSRYSPTRLSGQPVKVSGVVTYNFVLMP